MSDEREIKLAQLYSFFIVAAIKRRIAKMVALEPNQKTIARFLSELTRDWESCETLEIRCIRENFRPHSSRFALRAID